MEISIKSGDPTKQRTGCIVLAIFDSRKLSAGAQEVDKASNNHISAIMRKGDIEGSIGQSLLLHNVPGILSDRVLLIGCGKERELDERKFKQIILNQVRELDNLGAAEAVSYLSELYIKGRDVEWNILSAVQTTAHARYKFDEFKSKKDESRKPLRRLIYTVPTRKELNSGEKVLNRALAINAGVELVKDLANTPPNVCTPAYLAAQAEKLSKKYEKISTAVLDEKEIATLKMGSFLSVADGAKNRPKLITLEYRGARKDQKPIVLVGKGITFDTGGNSLKDPTNMIGMKYDMCGGATVLGVIKAAAQLDLKLNIVGVIPATENRLDGNSTRPDDIVTAMNGTTIEILNTDAEGRLILCDALTYAERFNPDVIIDIATLTGACVVALGRHASALIANHNGLANDLLAAGTEVGDKAWQMPYWDEYYDALKSNVADIANVAGNREAGTLVAGAFLGHFTQKMHWAHLDIAGTACTDNGRAASGRPVPLLVQYLINREK